MKLETVKKAYEVHDPTVWDNPHMIYPDEVYAETAGEAKRKCTDYSEFTNIRAKRTPDSDIVLYKGREVSRIQAKREEQAEALFIQRKNGMDKFSDSDTFYIQNGWVGNSVLWWALNSQGYTTDINKAQKYTKEECLKRFVNGRSEDKIWLSSHVDLHIRSHVDAQYLDSSNRI